MMLQDVLYVSMIMAAASMMMTMMMTMVHALACFFAQAWSNEGSKLMST